MRSLRGHQCAIRVLCVRSWAAGMVRGEGEAKKSFIHRGESNPGLHDFASGILPLDYSGTYRSQPWEVESCNFAVTSSIVLDIFPKGYEQI